MIPSPKIPSVRSITRKLLAFRPIPTRTSILCNAKKTIFHSSWSGSHGGGAALSFMIGKATDMRVSDLGAELGEGGGCICVVGMRFVTMGRLGR